MMPEGGVPNANLNKKGNLFMRLAHKTGVSLALKIRARLTTWDLKANSKTSIFSRFRKDKVHIYHIPYTIF